MLEATSALKAPAVSREGQRPARENAVSLLVRFCWRLHEELGELMALVGQLSLPGRYPDSRDSSDQ